MIKKTLFATAIAIITMFSANAQEDMGGPPSKAKKKTKKEITSPDKHKYTEVQKKYQNQIVFSKSEIKRDEENPAAFIKTWEMGEPLYFRVYHAQTLMESVYDYHQKEGTELNEYDHLSYSENVVVFINGKEMASDDNESKNKDYTYNWVTNSGKIYDNTQQKTTLGLLPYAISKAFRALENDFKEGSYEVEIKTYAMPSAINNAEKTRDKRHVLISSGKLTVNVTKAGMDKYAPYLCIDVLKSKGEMIDPVLENTVAEYFARELKVKVLAVNITDGDWTINRNGLGVVMFRSIWTSLVYVNTDGKTYIIDYNVKQEHDGSKFQTSVKQNIRGGYSPYCAYCTDYKKTLK